MFTLISRYRGWLWVTAVLAFAATIGATWGVAAAAEKPSAAIAHMLMTKDLADIPGKEVVMATIEYLPGGASMPHRHNANVFVYVLEGAVRMQVDGGKLETLRAGQTFYESPQDIHRVSANASKTQPAKFLVFMVANKGQPLTVPVGGGAGD